MFWKQFHNFLEKQILSCCGVFSSLIDENIMKKSVKKTSYHSPILNKRGVLIIMGREGGWKIFKNLINGRLFIFKGLDKTRNFLKGEDS